MQRSLGSDELTVGHQIGHFPDRGRPAPLGNGAYLNAEMTLDGRGGWFDGLGGYLASADSCGRDGDDPSAIRLDAYEGGSGRHG